MVNLIGNCSLKNVVFWSHKILKLVVFVSTSKGSLAIFTIELADSSTAYWGLGFSR